MSIVTYSAEEYQQAVVDFGRILNQYYDIASKTQSMAKLVGSRIQDAHDYAESIEELDDAGDKIDTWEVVAENIEKNVENVKASIQDLHNEAVLSNENIVKGLRNLQQMLGKTGRGLELGNKQVEQAAIDAENALSACKAETKRK